MLTSKFRGKKLSIEQISSILDAVAVTKKVYEERRFNDDEVQSVVETAISDVIGDSEYSSERAAKWSLKVTDACMISLLGLHKRLKYIVHTSVVPKRAELTTSSYCYWNSSTDGMLAVRWSNSTVCCIVSVFGVYL